MTDSKVVQHETVRAADPDLAFETAVFSDPLALSRYLEEQGDTTKVLRPEVTANTGSALFSRPGQPVAPEELAGLWKGGGRVLVHDFVPGTPYFANGVVVDGELRLTDTWRCFSLDEGPRMLLTAVVNALPGSLEVKLLEQALQTLVTASGVRGGPVCFEAVLSGDDRVKVVKYAYRIAGEPLPRLCGLLGVAGQSGDAAQTPDGFVADYAFIVRRGGTLTGFRGLGEVRRLTSYSGDLFMPAPGERVQRTVGEGGGAAVLLRHPDEATLLADLQYLQERNRAGVFDVAD
ncbi:hypothetical protein [Streptomyces sp. ISL-86]|uniref:hypothetical protein n=1 Tax=Streptomyces sp. ISL-86 TaxID=2819187 RepID=UPI001BEC0279|nr:hypothetical protein [Streptomyces sp. ISL-86]MBT2458739.1 hypothetical protein [Streptomyces sp. ISL-86]